MNLARVTYSAQRVTVRPTPHAVIFGSLAAQGESSRDSPGFGSGHGAPPAARLALTSPSIHREALR